MIDYVQETLKALRPNDLDWYGWKDLYIDGLPNPNLISYENAISIKDGVTKPSKDEFDAKYNEIISSQPFKNLRSKRNLLLAESDWWVLPDRTPTEAQLQYREALRDLPANSPNAALDENGDLINVEWPEMPQ